MKELPPRPDWALGNFDQGEHEPRLISSIADEPVVEMLNKRAGMLQKGWAANDVKWEEYMLDDAEYVCVAYGTSARVCKYAVNELRREGIKIGLIRPITLYPFPKKALYDLDYSRVKAIIDVEMAIHARWWTTSPSRLWSALQYCNTAAPAVSPSRTRRQQPR